MPRNSMKMPSQFWVAPNQHQTLYAQGMSQPPGQGGTKTEEKGPMARSDTYFSVVIKNKKAVDGL